jgi:hypothetical protein
MEKKAYLNPFEDVHQKAQAAHERLRQVREKDLLIRETQEAAESDPQRNTNWVAHCRSHGRLSESKCLRLALSQQCCPTRSGVSGAMPIHTAPKRCFRQTQ